MTVYRRIILVLCITGLLIGAVLLVRHNPAAVQPGTTQDYTEF